MRMTGASLLHVLQASAQALHTTSDMSAPSLPPVSPANDIAPSMNHSVIEDLVALMVGVLMIGLAISLDTGAGLLNGGVSGTAFLVHYVTGINYGAAFFALNLPFYWLALKRLGIVFTVKTFAAVALLSLVTGFSPAVFRIQDIHPAYAGVLGGVLMGTGVLVLFRHKASLGGVGIAAVYLQESRGWRAGHVQLAVDVLIALAALFVADPMRVFWSAVGLVVLNVILSLNHRTDRYRTA